MGNYWDVLPHTTREKIMKAGLENPGSIIDITDGTLRKHRFTPAEIEIIRRAAAQSLKVRSFSVKEMLECDKLQWKRISFGCQALDLVTGGGVQTRGITEIYGESGVGKTQILLQLSLMVQLPPHRGGMGKKAVFICTEDTFPSKRFFQFINKFQKDFPEKIDYAKNMYIESVFEPNDLMKTINHKLPKLLAVEEVGLIVIDSIAGVFRLESNLIERAKKMRDFAYTILQYIDKFKIAVVCINQVAAVVDSTESNSVQPCLGLAWANLITARFQISKTQQTCRESNNQTVIRSLKVIFAPDLRNASGQFIITSDDGIVDAPV